jgi:hypothetical protein
MSDNSERPTPEGPPSSSRSGGEPEAQPETPPNNHTDGASTNGPAPVNDPREALKKDLYKYRLPADVKEQILAELPPPEERERMYREHIEKGGFKFEEFFEAMVAELEEKP